jgi:hypothetical protein
MNRRTLSGVLRPTPQHDTFWEELCTRIKSGTVIPIVSNAVHVDRIFAALLGKLGDSGDPADDAPVQTIDELLAESWAAEIGYPLFDSHTLARVAQYQRLKSGDDEQARRTYLSFLKRALLELAERADPANAATVSALRTQQHERRFSDLAAELDLPGDTSPDDDPLRILARLNLPIYVTTSPYDFLERAIRAEGRTPTTQICGSVRQLQPEHQIDRDFEPSPQTPVVYHLHGLEEYPGALVLSEDDYLDFLVRVTQPIDSQRPVIPLYLTEKLAECTLLLLGYRLQDWDFRATFRGLIRAKETPRRPFSVAIQLSPREQRDAANPTEAERYLTEYFRLANFRVEWSDSGTYLRDLWQRWNRWRRGER